MTESTHAASRLRSAIAKAKGEGSPMMPENSGISLRDWFGEVKAIYHFVRGAARP